MTALGDGLGRVFNVVHEASGLDIPLTRGTAVSFVSFLAAGTQALTFTQTDSTGALSEANLNLFVVPTSAAPANLNSRIYAGPGVGGTWTAKARTADNVFTNADATNDAVVITVRAEQLGDGYDRVQCTAATGTCIAIVHDLTVQRRPSNLASSLVA